MKQSLLEPVASGDFSRQQRLDYLLDRVRSMTGEPDAETLRELTDLLPESDGEPVDSPWHLAAITLLIESLTYHWRARYDYFTGGNMFVYYSVRKLLTEDFKGPDYFYVSGVDRRKLRDKWVAWDENGKLPELIVEFLSPTTAKVDLTTKKALYEQTFRTENYYCYNPDGSQLQGWQLDPITQRYVDLVPNERGWLWSSVLKMWIGDWTGIYCGMEGTWPRFYDANGALILLGEEAESKRAESERQRAEAESKRADSERQRAEAESKRADSERQRAEAAEAELARLRAQLESSRRGNGPPQQPAS